MPAHRQCDDYLFPSMYTNHKHTRIGLQAVPLSARVCANGKLMYIYFLRNGAFLVMKCKFLAISLNSALYQLRVPIKGSNVWRIKLRLNFFFANALKNWLVVYDVSRKICESNAYAQSEWLFIYFSFLKINLIFIYKNENINAKIDQFELNWSAW